MKRKLKDIKEWLKIHYNTGLKSVSFLLHSEHGFQQAPLEKISKEEYDKMMASCTPIRSIENLHFTNEDDLNIGDGECAGGVCPIR